MVVDYSDIDSAPITDEQYKNNLLRQYPHLDPKLTIAQLEHAIDALLTN
jgi:hypothetical protein